jgi:hypothetical protein
MGSTILFLGLILLCAAAAVLYYVYRRDQKIKVERRASRRKKELDAFYRSPLQRLAQVDIQPDQGEDFYYAGVVQWALIPDGESQDRIREPGMLYLSNQRLCFVGTFRTEEQMPFGAWAEAKILPSSIELRLPGRGTLFIYSGDIMLAPIFGRLTKKQFAPLHS